MAFSLAQRDDAPAAFGRVSTAGVPRTAVVASTAVGVVAVIANYALPSVFTYLIASSGAIALITYLVIALTQYATGRRDDNDSDVRMWAFPYLTLATIAFIVAVLVLMAFLPEHRLELGLSLGPTAVLVAMGIQRQRTAAGTHTASPTTPETDKIPTSSS